MQHAFTSSTNEVPRKGLKDASEQDREAPSAAAGCRKYTEVSCCPCCPFCYFYPQAQRDFFGSHTYQRTDKEGWFHTVWDENFGSADSITTSGYVA